jgi:hypothetical protein
MFETFQLLRKLGGERKKKRNVKRIMNRKREKRKKIRKEK